MEYVRHIFGFDHCFVVEAHDRSRDLALFWSGGSVVKILCSNPSFIDMEDRIAELPVFRLTRFDSEPSR